MNPIYTGLLRHLLTTAGGWFVAQGKLDPTDVETLSGAILALIGVAWSLYHKRQVQKQITEAKNETV